MIFVHLMMHYILKLLKMYIKGNLILLFTLKDVTCFIKYDKVTSKKFTCYFGIIIGKKLTSKNLKLH